MSIPRPESQAVGVGAALKLKSLARQAVPGRPAAARPSTRIAFARMTQQDAAALLGIDQSKVSRITHAQFRGISEGKLLELVTKLGHDVKSVVGPMRRRAGTIELQFA